MWGWPNSRSICIEGTKEVGLVELHGGGLRTLERIFANGERSLHRLSYRETALPDAWGS
jgi:hypothetical protein